MTETQGKPSAPDTDSAEESSLPKPIQYVGKGIVLVIALSLMWRGCSSFVSGMNTSRLGSV